jgi:phospho-N-acetylmuramoyl-pentapeptide-transferase
MLFEHVFSIALTGLLSLMGCAFLMWYLSKKQSFHHIYHLSPTSHQSKKPTVSFGGVAILGALLIGVVLTQTTSPLVLWVMVTMLGFGAVGFYDDFLSFMSKTNKGLSAKAKFAWQWGLAAVSMAALFYLDPSLSLGYLLFGAFVLVTTSNATNLTDGCDGLLGGLTLISIAGLFLSDLYFEPDMAVFLGLFFASVLGFLILNRNPASLYMGDTGSLAIGAGLACIPIGLGNPWVILVIGSVYVAETLSVIFQVIGYKLTHKRLFLMAPFHHHLEEMGFSERTVVWVLWLSAWIVIGVVYWLSNYVI